MKKSLTNNNTSKNTKGEISILGVIILTTSVLFYHHTYARKNQLPSQKTNLTFNAQNIDKKESQMTIQPTINLKDLQKQIGLSVIVNTKKEYSLKKSNLPNQQIIKEILSGTPMEPMTDLISKQNKTIAAFLVGIALKESGLGKRAPKLNGKDCYNYWGYRGLRKKMGTGGHTCFDSPEDAINTVANRLNTLIVKQKRNTPQKMIIWKCGNSCVNHSSYSVQKWISDVSIYFNKINNS